MDVAHWKVIVVEDTFDDRQLVSVILRHYGIEVRSTANGNECLALLQDFEPTFVITDLAMPEKDGWQMLVAMRSNAKTAHIPVMATTAYHSSEVANDVFQAGFDGYFPKPVNPQTFVQSLRAIIV